jgi:hypothetical protein
MPLDFSVNENFHEDRPVDLTVNLPEAHWQSGIVYEDISSADENSHEDLPVDPPVLYLPMHLPVDCGPARGPAPITVRQ